MPNWIKATLLIAASLTFSLLAMGLVLFALWSFFIKPDEKCYMTENDGYRLVKVLDSAGQEYSPEPVSLEGTGETGCGIHRRAEPFTDGEQYYFEVPDGGIVPIVHSLTGRDQRTFKRVYVGLDDEEDWDSMWLWPLKGVRWGYASDLSE